MRIEGIRMRREHTSPGSDFIISSLGKESKGITEYKVG
jgi:hypothetical protein